MCQKFRRCCEYLDVRQTALLSSSDRNPPRTCVILAFSLAAIPLAPRWRPPRSCGYDQRPVWRPRRSIDERNALEMQMKVTFAVAALGGALAMCAGQAKTITGDWLGTLHVGAAELRLVVHISSTGSGFKGTMDSIDQPAANGIPIDSISLEDSKLTFTVAAVHGSYEGAVNA